METQNYHEISAYCISSIFFTYFFDSFAIDNMTSKVTLFLELNRKSVNSQGFLIRTVPHEQRCGSETMASEEGQNWLFLYLFLMGSIERHYEQGKLIFVTYWVIVSLKVFHMTSVFSNFKDNSFLIMEIRPTNELNLLTTKVIYNEITFSWNSFFNCVLHGQEY